MNLSDLLVQYSDFHGVYEDYIEKLYEYFCSDFIEEMPCFIKHEVDFTGKTKVYGKEATFWKLVTAKGNIIYPGSKVDERVLDIKRSCRIRWIKEIIENYEDESVKVWLETKNNQRRFHLIYNDEFLVVLGQQYAFPHFHIVTAIYVSPSNRDYYREIHKTLGLKKDDVAVATSYPFKP